MGDNLVAILVGLVEKALQWRQTKHDVSTDGVEKMAMRQ
jgi:hypothetical protein